MNLKTDQRRYKVFLDPSYEAEKEDGKTKEQWRYYELRGKYGTIYPYSETLLGVCYTSKRKSESVLAEKGYRVIQDGDEETVVVVDLKEFQYVAQSIKARLKRIGIPGSGDRLAKYHFKPKIELEQREG